MEWESGKRPWVAATLPFLLVLLIQLAGLLLPIQYAWGFNFWRVVAQPWNYLVLGIALCLLLVPIHRVVGRLLARAVHGLVALPRAVSVIGGSLILFLLFYVFRSRAFVYGDGLLTLNSHTAWSQPIEFAHYFTKPLGIYVDRVFTRFFSLFLPVEPAVLLGIVLAIAGVVGFWAVIRIARIMSPDTGMRVFIILGILSSGSVVLFFGYVEDYPWAIAFALWSLRFSLGYVKNREPLWPAFLFGVLAIGFHVLTAPFVLIPIMAVFLRQFPRVASICLWWVAAVAFVLSVPIVLLFFALGRTWYFVPLRPELGNQYWAFSLSHLLDMVNQILLVAPLGLLLLIFSGRKRENKEPEERMIDWSLGTLTILTFLTAFWLNPNLGAPRDWDLLSLFGIPLTLWGVYRYINRRGLSGSVHRLLTNAVIVAAICLIPNLIEKNNTVIATKRLDAILWHDAHYQWEYRNADRCVSWAFILSTSLGHSNRSLKYYHRRAAAAGRDPRSWTNLAKVYLKRGEPDSALFWLEEGRQSAQADVDYLVTLSKVEQMLGNLPDALRHAEEACLLAPGDPAGHARHAVVFAEQGRPAAALAAARQAYHLAPQQAEYATLLGHTFAENRVYDSALIFLGQGFNLAPDSETKMNNGEMYIRAALAQGDIAAAREMLSRLEAIVTHSADIRHLERIIERADTAGRNP